MHYYCCPNKQSTSEKVLRQNMTQHIAPMRAPPWYQCSRSTDLNRPRQSQCILGSCCHVIVHPEPKQRWTPTGNKRKTHVNDQQLIRFREKQRGGPMFSPSVVFVGVGESRLCDTGFCISDSADKHFSFTKLQL